MNQRASKNICSFCGVEFAIPGDGKPRTIIAGASGQPNMHVVTVDGEVVHRCEVQRRMDQADQGEDDAEVTAQMS